MQEPLQISFRQLDSSPALEALIREKSERMDQFFNRITSCNVIISGPPKRRYHGRTYDVTILINVPQRQIVVNTEKDPEERHTDPYVAVRDAFDIAYRQLEDYARELRGQVKGHEMPLIGEVARVIAEGDYGFVRLMDGEEVYFHRNSVTGGKFDDLSVGSLVRVVLAFDESPQGPQASTVEILGKNNNPVLSTPVPRP